MKYLDEMRTKYGFGDGGSVPADAEACRTVYVEALNRVAEKLGSTVRAYAYDRPGMHNPFLILFHRKDSPAEGELEPDEQMDDAIHACLEMDLDGLVEVQVTINPCYKEEIAQMAKEVYEN